MTEREQAIVKVLRPFAAIADAYDANKLDDDARRYIGDGDAYENRKPPATIGLYHNRGGRTLLTLEHCMEARDVLRMIGGGE